MEDLEVLANKKHTQQQNTLFKKKNTVSPAKKRISKTTHNNTKTTEPKHQGFRFKIPGLVTANKLLNHKGKKSHHQKNHQKSFTLKPLSNHFESWKSITLNKSHPNIMKSSLGKNNINKQKHTKQTWHNPSKTRHKNQPPKKQQIPKTN